MKVVSVQEMRQIEASVDASIMSYDQMMLNAGQAAGTYLMERLNITAETRITFLIGKGNNGGDGLVMAHHLSQNSQSQIRLYMLEPRRDDDKNYQAVVEDGLFIANVDEDRDSRVLKNLINSADIIVDALFGIGICLPLRDTSLKILRIVNSLIALDDAILDDDALIDPTSNNQRSDPRRPFILAIDCPSGVDCDTGDADKNTIQADETITFIAAKHGLFTFPAAKYVGKLVLSQIGIPDSQPDLSQKSHFVIDSHYVKKHLPQRPIDGHKGTFGKAFIIAGSKITSEQPPYPVKPPIEQVLG